MTEPRTVGDFLQQATAQLAEAGIDSARLDCLILLEDVLAKDRAALLAHPELAIPSTQQSLLNNYITQRKQHVPLAYIRGQAAFYGRRFAVSQHTLIPRPETEGIIELLKEIPFSAPPLIADIGTGSGCIGITAALEIPGTVVHLYDISANALTVAKQNARKHHVRPQYYQGDLFAQAFGDYTVIVANLPYVPDQQAINKAASFEPRQALFSGADGLDHYRRFWRQVGHLAHKPAYVITESQPNQQHALDELATQSGYVCEKSEGFVQRFALRTPTAV